MKKLLSILLTLSTITLFAQNETVISKDGETITGGTSEATASITNVNSSTVLAITIPNGTFSASETITGGTSGATATVSSAVSLEDTQAAIDVLSAVTRQDSGTSSQSDLSITRIGRDAYLSLTNKRSTGRPVRWTELFRL